MRFRREVTTWPCGAAGKDQGGDQDDQFAGREAVGEFTERVVQGVADGELVGDPAQFLARGVVEFLRRHRQCRTHREPRLGGVGEDAGQFGELADEGFRTLRPLPVEEGVAAPHTGQRRQYAEVRGEYRADDEVQGEQTGHHIDDVLARCQIEAGGGDLAFDALAQLGGAQLAVDTGEATAPYSVTFAICPVWDMRSTSASRWALPDE